MKRVVVRGGSVKDNGLLSSKGISIEENSNNGMKDSIISILLSLANNASYIRHMLLIHLNLFLRYK